MQPLSGKARSETQIIEQARSLMLAEQTRDMPLEDIAKNLNISYTSFRRTFREHTGASPHQYRPHPEISAARELLRSTDLRVKERSAIDAGSMMNSTFAGSSSARPAILPSSFRRGLGPRKTRFSLISLGFLKILANGRRPSLKEDSTDEHPGREGSQS
jgi:methylphosphotriester-DNA--protein-cysteine methyltransferase